MRDYYRLFWTGEGVVWDRDDLHHVHEKLAFWNSPFAHIEDVVCALLGFRDYTDFLVTDMAMRPEYHEPGAGQSGGGQQSWVGGTWSPGEDAALDAVEQFLKSVDEHVEFTGGFGELVSEPLVDRGVRPDWELYERAVQDLKACCRDVGADAGVLEDLLVGLVPVHRAAVQQRWETLVAFEEARAARDAAARMTVVWRDHGLAHLAHDEQSRVLAAAVEARADGMVRGLLSEQPHPRARTEAPPLAGIVIARAVRILGARPGGRQALAFLLDDEGADQFAAAIGPFLADDLAARGPDGTGHGGD